MSEQKINPDLMKQLYCEAMAALVGDTISCPVCRDSIIKNRSNRIFCTSHRDGPGNCMTIFRKHFSGSELYSASQKTDEQRFHEGYEIVTESGCWIWIKACGKAEAPHGRIMYKGRLQLAHRVSYMLKHMVDLGENDIVCHRCDVYQCVNPDHLYLGDMHQNTLDQYTRKRRPTVLTEESVRQAKRLLASGVPSREIREQLSLSVSELDRIREGRSWAWVKP